MEERPTVEGGAKAVKSPADAIPEDEILGYTTPMIVRPGGVAEVRVSTTAARYEASVVRVNAAGPGTRVSLEEFPQIAAAQTLAGSERAISAGSSIAVGPSPAFGRLFSFTAAAWIFPTLATSIAQVVMGTLDADAANGWQVVLDRDRGLGIRFAIGGGRPVEHFTGVPVRCPSWTHIVVAADSAADEVRLHQSTRGLSERVVTAPMPVSSHRPGDLLVVGAPQNTARPVTPDGNGCFNGKVSGPVVLDGAVAPDRVGSLRSGRFEECGIRVVCALDLADAIGRSSFQDRSPERHRARVLNMPTSGVTGPRWRALTSSYLQAKGDYDAIHLHDDDLEDADLEVAFKLRLPEDLGSGVYAVRLRTAGCTDLVPFFVTAPNAPRHTDVALLLPTLTYLAYANEHEPRSNPPSFKAFTGRELSEARLSWHDRLALANGLLSLYDVHRDGSPVVHASTRRPLLNVRPDYEWYLLEGPHGLAMDLRLIGFLSGSGFEFDLLTDHDLHAGGLEVISPYRVLVTGAHPEYWTAAMLDSLEAYLDEGGRILYPGGNGLCWVTGIDADRPHVMEVRRGMVGSRPSSSPPGESWLTTSLEEGGLWRVRGRGSHQLLGVGTTAMGGGPGRPYRRSEVSYEPEYSWAFEGVDGEEIGASGILGGAAAYEFDRADTDLGTPDCSEVLATASGFRHPYLPMIEDFMGTSLELTDPSSPLVRADMVMTIRDNGGGVFAAGSAAWCGSLVDEEAAPTDVGVVTTNVLRRFIETPRGTNPRQGAQRGEAAL